MDWLSELTPWFEHGSYFAVFFVLVLCGIGLPIPEEITFIAAGVVVQRIDANVWIMIAVGLVGILAGDSLTYMAGRRYGMAVLSRWPFKRFVKKDGIEKARRFIDQHGSHSVFIAGFLAGVRAPTYFLCGSMGLSYARFVLWDLARAILTCPISVWLAWRFGKHAEHILREYSYIPVGLIAVVCLVILFRYMRGRRLKRAAMAQQAAETSSDAKASGDPTGTPDSPAVKETSGA